MGGKEEVMNFRELKQRVTIWRISRAEERQPVWAAAMVVAEEAAEVLECFSKGRRDRLAEELADVVIAAVDLANVMGVNLEEAIERKMEVLENRPGLRNR